VTASYSSTKTISPTRTATVVPATGTETITNSPSPSVTPTASETFTQTPLPSATATFAPTVPPITPGGGGTGGSGNGSSFSLTLFNAAGEAVKVITSNQMEVNSTQDFKVLDPAFAPTTGQQAAILVDGQTYLWNGSNDNGQQVASGIYYIKLEEHDPYGNVITYIHEVVVLAVGNQIRLKIFNSAGEEIKTLMVATYSTQAPSRLVPDKDTAALTANGSTAFTFDLGGISVTWDGTNNAGQQVSSGSYLVQLEVQNLAGAQTIASTSVTVINAGGPVLSGVFVAPNPVPASASGFELRWKAIVGIEVTARLYNVAGELVMIAGNGSSADKLLFDLSNRPIAGGIYLVAVTAKAPWGAMERRTLKLVMVR
jgi:hypothetical protein